MPFPSGKKPALKVTFGKVQKLADTLVRAGYENHDGRKLRDRNEVLTFRKRYLAGGNRRQCHVQFICVGPNCIEIYAHTEPDIAEFIDYLMHGVAALTDKVSYQAGAKMLKRDLANHGWKHTS